MPCIPTTIITDLYQKSAAISMQSKICNKYKAKKPFLHAVVNITYVVYNRVYVFMPSGNAEKSHSPQACKKGATIPLFYRLVASAFLRTLYSIVHE